MYEQEKEKAKHMNKDIRILITGAAGFIGTNFIQYLKESNYDISTITGIDNLSTGRKMDIHKEIYFEQLDIRDRLNIDRLFEQGQFTHCLHLAGLVSIYDCNKDPKNAFDNNVIGSINVIDACVKYGVKLIAAETSAVYEGCELPTGGSIVSSINKMHTSYKWPSKGYEETQSCPETIYAITKATIANIVHSASKYRGLEYNMLRFFNVAGYLQDYRRTVPALHCGFIIRILQGKPVVVFGDITRRRDFIHVDDVCDFLWNKCILSSAYSNETYNLGTGISVSLEEIKDIVYGTFGLEPKEPMFLPEINAEAHTIFANISKAKSTGWCPKKGMTEIIQDTYEYIVNEIENGNIAADFMDDIEEKYQSVKI